VAVADRVFVLEKGRVKASGEWDSVRGMVEAE